MAGALIGFVLGFAGFIVLRMLARRVETREDVTNAGQVAGILRYAALADWLLMIVLGFFVGPMLASGAE
jgi:hypothetical protein